MIRLAGNEDLEVLRPDSEAAVRILGLYTAYGISAKFLRFWCDPNRQVFISLLDGTASVAITDDADVEETAAFLKMQPEIRNIRTSGKAAKEITGYGGWTLESGSVMTTDAGLQTSALKPEELSPREVYPLLASCFENGLPPFDSWYVDVSHRIRHGCCRIYGFRHDGKPVSCAMTTSECCSAAVIGGVATLQEARGRGYASSIVLTLAEKLMNEGKAVFLSPKNDPARLLYSRLGFRECGGWGNLKKSERA